MIERDSPDSPWIQAGRLTFMALYAVTVLAAWPGRFPMCGRSTRRIAPWCCTSAHSIGFQNAGLLLAWPQPFEQVVLLPAQTG